jgi:hypothetical protein
MNQELPETPRAHVSRWRALLLLALVVAVILLGWRFVLSQRPPGIDRFFYPSAQLETRLTAPKIVAACLSSADSPTTVLNHYLKQFEMAPSGDPVFYSKAHLFGLGAAQVMMRLSSPPDQLVVLAKRSAGDVIFVLISPALNTNHASILILGAASPEAHAKTTFNPPPYPGSAQASGGFTTGIKAYRYTTDDDLAKVWTYFTEQFKIPSAVVNPAPLTWNLAGGVGVNVTGLRNAPGTTKSVLFIGPDSFHLVHAAPEPDGQKTHLLIIDDK